MTGLWKTIGKQLVVLTALVAAYKIVRKVAHLDTYEKLSDKLEELSNKYSENESKLSDINAQLEENYQRMEELSNLDNPTYVDNEELEK